MSKLTSLKAHVKRWGLLGTTRYVLLSIGSDVLGIHLFVARGREASDELRNPCALTDIEFRQLEAEELERYSQDKTWHLDKAFVQDALQRGDIAYGAYDGPKLVAYVWRTMSCAPHTDDVWVRVRKPYGYSYKSFARPEYRGNRIVPGLVLHSDKAMRELGYTHRVGLISRSNFASMAMGPSLGSPVIGHLGYVHWFGRHYFFHSRAVANIGMELFDPADH